jgi:hypothetical protein
MCVCACVCMYDAHDVYVYVVRTACDLTHKQVPTRELALQVLVEVRKFLTGVGKGRRGRVCSGVFVLLCARADAIVA